MANDKVVITGISGVYPKCNNIAELAEKLFAKEDLITDLDHINFSVGKLNTVKKFDSEFFEITSEHAAYMDPMCRILLEKTFEAIIDAGYNPQELRNSRTAVFVANCTSDAEVESTFRTDVKGALICERAQSFLANRISYCFSFTGPSGTVNTACSSSMYALDFACKSIKSNECDSAIVGGSNLCLAPGMIHLYKNLGITSTRCRSFDDAAIGFCRSEAISAIFLQREKNARRLYAEVVHVKTNNDGYKKQSILFPSHISQTRLINQVYQECGVPKSQISWVEAHGTGTRVGDYQEMKSLETLCENRSTPLLAGCVKSSLGHTEAASGLCSIGKVIISMETNRIPPNLHFNKAQSGIDVLLNNKIKIITETTPWEGGYVAINNFGIGGANAHLVLKSHSKNKTNIHYKLPTLVTISGRTEKAIEKFVSYFKNNSLDVEFVGLLHKIFSSKIPNHDYRGYIIASGSSSVTSHQQKIKNLKRPVWFIYPGMGSQWPGMAKQLLEIEVFQNSILECHQILLQKDVDLFEILTNENDKIFTNILNCFVGITAVMISLTDLLESIGIEPDGVIGHSFGEICCAYSDKCLSKEEALFNAYYRGLTSIHGSTIKGMMAVIGLDGQKASKRCPQSIEIACYNGKNSCTIAGPQNDVQIFIQHLKSQNIFATDIFSANIAYHSSYIQSLGSTYYNHLKQIIKNPQPRSSKWISSTITTADHPTMMKYCTAEYFKNNFLNPVRLDEALKHIPNNAVTIEISPHCILKSILHSTLNHTITNISLLNKNTSNQVNGLLGALGRLYNENIDVNVSRLYPSINFPVSRGTAMISPLVEWNHEKDWYVPFETFNPLPLIAANEGQVVIDCGEEEWKFLRGHIIDGRNIVPQCVFLKIITDLAAKRNNDSSKSVIIFEDVNFYKSVEIPSKGRISVETLLTRSNNYFEITLDEVVIVSGFVSLVKPSHEPNTQNLKVTPTECESLDITSDDLYKELKIKGYSYKNDFQTLMKSNINGTLAQIKWTGHLVIDLNTILQLIYLQEESDNENYYQVSQIGFLRIDNILTAEKEEKFIRFQPLSNRFVAKNLIMKEFAIEKCRREIPKEPILQSIEFVPYFPAKIIPIDTIIQIILSIILENNLNSKINVYEFADNEDDLFSLQIYEHFQILSFYKVSITVHNKSDRNLDFLKQWNNFHVVNKEHDLENEKNIHLLVLTRYENYSKMLRKCLHSLAESGFVITREDREKINFHHKIPKLKIAAEYHLAKEKVVLWHKVLKSNLTITVNMDEGFNWINHLQNSIESSSAKIILFTKQKHSGILGFYNSVRKEVDGERLRCFMAMDPILPEFDAKNQFYSSQSNLDLAVNVYRNGKWGCYVHLRLKPEMGINSMPTLTCSREECFIICGGLGGMGFEVAGWLVTKGARKLILVSRTGNCDGYKLRKILKWRQLEVTTVISVDDISNVDGVQNLLQAANKLGIVTGIFNSTLILQDNIFKKQTKSSFRLVAKPKTVATSLLDSMSRKMCPHLQHFVVFSSIACGYGSAGQSNYAYANSAMERICETRRDEGLPALAVEWAGVGDVGYLEKHKMNTAAVGTSLQPIRSCLKVLDKCLNLSKNVVSSFVVSSNSSEDKSAFGSRFTTVKTIMDKSDPQPQKQPTLSEIGLDSIAIAEVKNILEHHFNIFMNSKEIMNLKVVDLWELERTSNLPMYQAQKSLRKLAMLQKIYSNLFQIMSGALNLNISKPLIRLPSFLHNGATNVLSTTKEKTIYFLPSVEGFASVMQPLAKNLDLQVLCAQYNLHQISVKQIVTSLMQEIERSLESNQEFHILAYSYGGLVGMEIVHALEKKGRIGYLYMVDSSPSIVKYISENLFKDEAFRTNNLAFVQALNCEIDLQTFESDLMNLNNWTEIEKLTIDILPDTITPDKKTLNAVLSTLHGRVNDIDMYRGVPKKSLISKVFLFKPAESLFDESVENDLSEFCYNPVQEFCIEGNHFSILQSENLGYYMRNLSKKIEI